MSNFNITDPELAVTIREIRDSMQESEMAFDKKLEDLNSDIRNLKAGLFDLYMEIKGVEKLNKK